MSIRLDALILKILSCGEMHGHQIITELNERSDGFFTLQTGTVYPLLKSLEKQELIAAHTALISGRERKRYSLTEAGKRYLQDELDKWRDYCRAVEKVMSD